MTAYLPFMLVQAALLAQASTPVSVQIDPPPGWEDLSSTHGSRHVRALLRGPETSSFVLVRIAPMSLDNRGRTRAYLVDAVEAVAKQSGEPFQALGALQSATYDNGVTVHFIRAQLKSKPRLALGLLEFGGETLLATLSSAVPDTMLPSILGSLRGVPIAAVSGGRAHSVDRQLAFKLPAGVVARGLVERERRQGFVLAARGWGSELMVMKLTDPQSLKIKEQPDIVRDTVLSFGGVERGSFVKPRRLDTPAGPALVYASAKIAQGSGGGEFAAGYLPWCYWGYSLLAKGPEASRLLRESFAGLEAGASAMPKLVAQTPDIPLGRSLPKLPSGWGGPAAIVATIAFAFWIARRRM